MTIGQIITATPLENDFSFIEVTDTIGDAVYNIPTLIVGKKLAESIYGKDKIKILNRNIDSNTSWTFSKFEKYTIFEEDLKQFRLNLLHNVKSKISYKFYSITTNPLLYTKKLILYIRSRKVTKTIFKLRGHLYIYDGSNRVLGISLNEIEYFGVKPDKVLSIIRKNPANKIFNGYADFSPELKAYIGGDMWLVPYLFYKKEA